MRNSIVGEEIDGYQVQEVLGQGGMGVVYKAEDVALSRPVALKSLNPRLTGDEAVLRRFRSEARAIARINSPYIVQISVSLRS
jgi:serine/threonine protein kinase